MVPYQVRPFGIDCLGNITGYYVARGNEWPAEHFVGNIYEPGSFEAAKQAAAALANELNQ